MIPRLIFASITGKKFAKNYFTFKPSFRMRTHLFYACMHAYKMHVAFEILVRQSSYNELIRIDDVVFKTYNR